MKYCGFCDMDIVRSWYVDLLHGRPAVSISVLEIRQTLVAICLAPIFTCSNKCLLVKSWFWCSCLNMCSFLCSNVTLFFYGGFLMPPLTILWWANQRCSLFYASAPTTQLVSVWCTAVARAFLQLGLRTELPQWSKPGSLKYQWAWIKITTKVALDRV